MTYSITWDLDSIFPNGSESKELSQRMTQLTEQTKEYHQLITEWTPESAQGKEQFAEILTLQGKISNGFSSLPGLVCLKNIGLPIFLLITIAVPKITGAETIKAENETVISNVPFNIESRLCLF